MKHDTAPQMKLRADGSIDTAFYMKRGRRMRSERAHEMLKSETPARASRKSTGYGFALRSLFAF